MGNMGSHQTSVVGEIVTLKPGDFYSYGNKYINSDQTSALIAPADVTPELYDEISQTAIKVCEVLECEGLGGLISLSMLTTESMSTDQHDAWFYVDRYVSEIVGHRGGRLPDTCR